MIGSRIGFGLASFAVVLGALSMGCGSSQASGFSGDGGGQDGQSVRIGDAGRPEVGQLMVGSGGGTGTDAGFSSDAFFATDPPPMYCGVDGGTAPVTPGGTPMCPSDKNREGCPCPTQGMTAACWPGLRVDRNIGQCKDGTTTCVTTDEGLETVWGPCMGYVLPATGATTGAPACKCFSSGQWAIANLEPCFYSMSASGPFYGAASVPVDGGVTCPSTSLPPMAPPTWSTDTLKVDCEGRFTLCYTIKAGSASKPLPTDCVVGQSCVSGDYTTANAVQPFPPLPGWASTDTACSDQFNATGGYGQMTVQGLSELCEAIGANDGGAPMVFSTVSYCSSACQANPSAAGCSNCQSGGSGTFGN